MEVAGGLPQQAVVTLVIQCPGSSLYVDTPETLLQIRLAPAGADSAVHSGRNESAAARVDDKVTLITVKEPSP
jgi:hypothetical protein